MCFDYWTTIDAPGILSANPARSQRSIRFMATLPPLKIIAAVATIIGLLFGFLERYFRPSYMLLEHQRITHLGLRGLVGFSQL